MVDGDIQMVIIQMVSIRIMVIILKDIMEMDKVHQNQLDTIMMVQRLEHIIIEMELNNHGQLEINKFVF